MPLSFETFGYFSGETGLVGFCNPVDDTLDLGNTGINTDFTAPLVDILDFTQQTDLSNPLMNYAGAPVLLLGVDLTTGAYRPLTPSDSLLRSNGSPAFATGLFGVTGILGATGAALQGVTGLLGTTGILGVTGIAGNSGFTGIQGLGGATGLTGNNGPQGNTGLTGDAGQEAEEGHRYLGDTGISGSTGITGFTGVGIQGTTGLGGAAFDQGITGFQGITGVISSSQGLTGLQGVAGNTGIQGATGIIQRGVAQPLATLNVQTTPSSNLQYTLPGGTLTTNDVSYLDIIVGGTLISGTSNTITLSFGGSTLFSDTNIFAEISNSFYLKAFIHRNTNTQQICFVEVISSNGYKSVTRNVTSLTMTNNILIQASASGTVDLLAIRLVN